MKKAETILTSGKIHHWLYYAAISSFVFLIYGNSIRNEYAMDDEIVTATYERSNPRIEKGIKGIPNLFTTRYVQTGQQSFDYRPLVLSTFAIEYQLFKKNPHISHFISVALYLIICLLIFSTLRTIFPAFNIIFPLLVTLLFAAHPIHTEVVDNIKNRDELMSFFFGLLALRYSLKYIDNNKIIYAATAGFFMLAAFLSKKTVVVFIPIIPLTILFFRSVKPSKIVYPLLLVVTALILFFVLKKSLLTSEPVKRIFVFTENPLFYEPFGNRIPAALSILWYYLRLMIIPFPLSSYYGYNTIPIAGWNSYIVWISLALHGAIAIFALLNYKKNKILSYGLLFYLIAIAPYSNLVRVAVGIIAERFAFTASLGFSIVIVCLLFAVFKISFINFFSANNNSKWALTAYAVILVSFSALSVSRNSDWKDLETLFKVDVKNFDNSHNLHLLNAKLLEQKIYRLPSGPERNYKIEKVLSHSNRIIEIVKPGIDQYPSDYLSRNNLGIIYLEYLNRPELSQPFFEQALSIKPDYVEANYNLGFSYEKRMLTDSAIKYFEKVLEYDNSHRLAYSHLHQQLLNKKDFRKAIEYSERAIKAFPENAEFYINLGNSYMLEKDTLSGIEYFVKGLNVEPANTNLRSQIVNFLKTAGFAVKAHELEHY